MIRMGAAGCASALALVVLVSAGSPAGASPSTEPVLSEAAPVPAPPAAADPADTGAPLDDMPTLSEAFAGIPEAVIDAHLANLTCEDLASDHMHDRAPVVGALSPVATLYAIPCVAGARETSYRLYLHETGEIGGVHPLYFAVWSPENAWMGTELLRDVRFDPESGQLTGESAGTAGSGPSATCRVRGTWRWNRWAFRLERMETRGCAAGVPGLVFP